MRKTNSRLLTLLCLSFTAIPSHAFDRSKTETFCIKRAAPPAVNRISQTDIMLPDVILLEPENPLTTDNQQVRLRALLRSRAPLTGVAITLNGQPFKKIKLDRLDRYVLDLLIPLAEGRNVIAVTATNAKMSSTPSLATVIYKPNESQPGLAVLAIGIPNSRGSKFAAANAKTFANLMRTQKSRGLFANVEVKELVEEKTTTRNGIFEGLKWLKDQRKSPNDVTMLFISGALETNYKNSSTYLLTSQHEAKSDLAIADFEFSVFWEYLASEQEPTLIFVDTEFTDGGGKFLAQPFSRYFDIGLNVYLYSFDGKLSETELSAGHSVFTMALLEGLTAKGDLDFGGTGKDGLIDNQELQVWLARRVEHLTGGKVPTMQVGRKRLPIFKLSPEPQ